MRYPPQFLDRLRQHYRLSEVIGRRIAIKRAGREYHALCPFHNEKTPSFTINDEKGFYHCFGCGKHGDVIGFYVDYEHLSYKQAIESLAREAGIALPEITPRVQKQIDESERLYKVMEAAADWFALQLRQVGGAEAREYLQRRGLQEETLREFRLGYAPSQRTALKNALMQQGFSEMELVTGGLLARPEEGGATYDKFRARIMFPINDSAGRVIAFGGRLMDPEAKGPKYLNSPDTPLFKKSYNLYHLDVARRAAAKAGAMLVAEGYMDVIALAQAGIDHAVAPLGTAITKEQLGLLWQLSDEPALCLDGDNAGWRAMERALELALPMLSPGKSLAFVRLPPGEDPDSVVQKHGAAAMEKLLSLRQPLIDVLWQKYVEAKKPATPEQIAGVEQELKKATDRIEHASVREHYRQAIKQRLWQMQRSAGRPPNARTPGRGPQGRGQPGKSVAGRGQPVTDELKVTRPALLTADQQRSHTVTACHRTLLTLLSYYPGLIEQLGEEWLVAMALGDALLAAQRDLLLSLTEAEEPVRREAVQALGEARLGVKAWKALLKSGAIELPRPLLVADEETGLPSAAAQLEMIQRRLEVMALEDDFSRAQAELGRDTNDKNRERFEALHRRIQEVRNSQSFFPESGEA